MLKIKKVKHIQKVCRSQSRQAPRDDMRHRAVYNVCHNNEDMQVATQEFHAVKGNYPGEMYLSPYFWNSKFHIPRWRNYFKKLQIKNCGST